MQTRIKQIKILSSEAQDVMESLIIKYAELDAFLITMTQDLTNLSKNTPDKNFGEAVRLVAIARTDLESSCMYANKAVAFADDEANNNVKENLP